jgi:hypothetical protein
MTSDVDFNIMQSVMKKTVSLVEAVKRPQMAIWSVSATFCVQQSIGQYVEVMV